MGESVVVVVAELFPETGSAVVVLDGASCPVTIVAAAAASLSETGSVVVEATIAVLDSEPTTVGVTTIVIVAPAPLARSPIAQVTIVVPLHEPTDELAETNDTPAGNGSETVTPEAASGPLFVTASV